MTIHVGDNTRTMLLIMSALFAVTRILSAFLSH